jgi:hypothetical protein
LLRLVTGSLTWSRVGRSAGPGASAVGLNDVI